jgi:hypothetical protein
MLFNPRRGAPLVAVLGATLFAGALGGMTGLDDRLRAAAGTSVAPTSVTPAPDTPAAPARVSDGRQGPGECRGSGDGRRTRDHWRSPHDRQEA